MGRHAGGWKLEERRGGYWYVRFTHAKRRHLISTGTRDRAQAGVEAGRLYARVVAGGNARPASTRALVLASLTTLLGEWLATLEGTLDPETLKTYETTYAGKHWIAHFDTVEDMCSEVARERYRSARLKSALAETVKKETWVQDKFLRWCKTHGVISQVPPALVWESTTLGTRTGKQRKHPRDLSQEQIERFLAALPPWFTVGKRALEKKPYPIRDRFIFAYETGLRPATISALIWSDWLGATLRIRAEADKIRYGREVPLSARARKALDNVAWEAALRGLPVVPDAPIFGAHAYAKTLKRAAKAVGLEGVAPYDLRHGRSTHLADAGAAITGIGFLVGHKQATTTNRYLHQSRKAAEAALATIPGAPSKATGPEQEIEGDRRGLNPRHLEPQGSGPITILHGYAYIDADSSTSEPAETEELRVLHPVRFAELLSALRMAQASVYGGRVPEAS